MLNALLGALPRACGETLGFFVRLWSSVAAREREERRARGQESKSKAAIGPDQK
jgi:hypothetical protein